jgi:rhamnose utilization protein RhaD (predicted bifunctional aldolase and dehydrogenase)
MKVASSIEKQVKEFCTRIGADRLLVQGAGGNVSWKDGDVLWIKASGTWLAEAESKEIFVPVNLPHLQGAIAKQDFSVKPEVKNDSGLRPSIETLLHALMPHRVVVHLHAVEILAHLVKVEAIQKINSLVDGSVKWIYVDYFKPGADLARAIFEKRTNGPAADVVFMGNHGVVIGGENVDEVFATLHTLTIKLKAPTSLLAPDTSSAAHGADFIARGYVPCVGKEVSLLALKEELFNRLRHEWALYPDHVVFLGAAPTIIEGEITPRDLEEIASSKPPYVFYLNDLVYESVGATAAQKAQLCCYYDVLIRQSSTEKLSSLTDLQVSDLLNWDAEKHRQAKS